MRFCVHVRGALPSATRGHCPKGERACSLLHAQIVALHNTNFYNSTILTRLPETNNPKSLIRLLYTNGRFGIMRYEAIISLAVQTNFVTFVANRH